MPVTPQLSCGGGPVLAHGRDQPLAFAPGVAQLPQAIAAQKPTHPDEDCALVPHRVPPLARRWQALCFAPLLGLERLPGGATPEPPLQTLRGRGSQSATRRQLLGPLERVGAAAAWMSGLVRDQADQLISVAGLLRASGSRRARPKGTSTMLGRILAGSHAVSAQEAAGQAVFVAYEPPDIQLSQSMVVYGQ